MTSTPPPGAIRTFLIADVRGYTRFTEEHGDLAASRLAGRFSEITEGVVVAAGGTVVEFRGDEALAVFESARGAIGAAVELQRRLADATRSDASLPLPAGIGLDAGEAVPFAGGYRGGALNLAARLCGKAAAGEILASREVAHLAGRVTDVAYEDRGTVQMKNLTRPVQVVRIVPIGDDPARLPAEFGTPSPARLRVAIAEDSILVREILVRVLTETGCEIVSQSPDADGLLAAVRQDPPDVVVTDIRMPPTHTAEGLVAALTIRSEFPKVAVLVLSQYVELGLALTLLADSAEGVGYLLKDRISDVDEFVAALRRVADGGSALDPIIVSTLVSRERPGDPLAQLTPREREVLELMAGGSSNQGIADSLVITVRAVEKYVSSIFTKLGLPSTGSESRRVLAVLTFLRS
jgi:DNA-binding NarL/FixJ family response regulator/class 3 adenylate cyclase